MHNNSTTHHDSYKLAIFDEPIAVCIRQVEHLIHLCQAQCKHLIHLATEPNTLRSMILIIERIKRDNGRRWEEQSETALELELQMSACTGV